MKRQDSVYIVLLLVVLFFMGLPLSTDANCNTPIGAPHQSVAKNPSPDNFIYGISANISYGTPVLGCQNKLDSFTDEWVMVVGPGPEEWLQFGWERKAAYSNLHLWYQYHHQGAAPVDVDIFYEPVTTHEYRIMAVRNSQTGIISWWLVDNGLVRVQLATTDMGWTQPTSGASQAQWSAELSYGESEMGDLLPDLVSFDNLYFQEGTPSSLWQQVVPSWTFDSFLPRYGGDTVEYEPYRWRSRNWTWPYQHYLPLMQKNS